MIKGGSVGHISNLFPSKESALLCLSSSLTTSLKQVLSKIRLPTKKKTYQSCQSKRTPQHATKWICGRLTQISIHENSSSQFCVCVCVSVHPISLFLTCQQLKFKIKQLKIKFIFRVSIARKNQGKIARFAIFGSSKW